MTKFILLLFVELISFFFDLQDRPLLFIISSQYYSRRPSKNFNCQC